MTTNNQSLPSLPFMDVGDYGRDRIVFCPKSYSERRLREYGDTRADHAQKLERAEIIKCLETNWLATNSELVKKIKELK